ncbi:MAG: CocE/NonD family hydrolase [Gammaproteobacteria bacterium]|nr:CocE/NonD family hydrolase [Gammaproteobacteria bacterium]NIN39651.1 CocE/NonD family hydrolase [Gammaproteobacteria bacterium]NIO25208.1 CocE/NonD family hydrolase [Gammaproteobacteria bacterium]NIO65837.1 CocE/NonD family hydrolase [Gammaproteobacteria bacterium]NIP64726.1 CocE/NonD family hydrolase [Gammaproteobacteria bacterium]
MKAVDTFPHRVRTVENTWIPLSDGTRLAARIWMPEEAERSPVPAILEYIPYRKRDFTRARDEPIHRYFAGHGYAAVRVDLRGSGDSDGVLFDEYLLQEQLDAVEVIAWLSEQPWCSGSVGMMGISWGGFNALQVAAHRPPALGAVITLCSSDDRYADDVHYMGGCLLNDNLIWGATMVTLNALPPDPEIVGEGWRDMWHERLKNIVLLPELWLGHPHRDEYWQQGSVCEDYSRIGCPVYAIGGWADGYSNAVPRLLAGLSVPRKGLVGPWSHNFPHNGVPGPAIGFLQEALRWWDHWLKDIDTGVMDEPMYRVWMQDSAPARSAYDVRPGRWVAEQSWPSPRIVPTCWYLSARQTLEQHPDEPACEAEAPRFDLQSPQNTGLCSGEWCGYGSEGEAPIDQREDDGKSLCFDTSALQAPVALLGAPTLELELSCDAPVAMLAVRLNDLSPDGASTRVSYGLLNLTHRDGHESPEAMIPGDRYRVTVRLNDVAHRFVRGHVIRLAVSSAYWPIAWPAPGRVTISVYPGASRLLLPVRPASEIDDRLARFGPPECARIPEATQLRPAQLKRTYERDLTSSDTVYSVYSDGGDFEGAAISRVHDIDLDIGHTVRRRYCIGESDPLTARVEIVQTILLRRAEWQIRVESRAGMSSTPDSYMIQAYVEAHEGDECVFTRHWDSTLARELA